MILKSVLNSEQAIQLKAFIFTSVATQGIIKWVFTNVIGET